MLTLTDLDLRRGPDLLLGDVTLTIHRGQRVGITGANGTGKSSLLALIRGELAPDKGELSLPDDLVIAHVAQETPAVERAAIEYVMDGDAELRDIERRLTEADERGDGVRQGELHGHLESIGGYAARARAAKLMHGLGFTPGQDEQSVSSFSGGWRMRLNLARALMCRSDLLLLDEPTNHLDLDAVLWLQGYLKDYPGTLLLISHDRDFLDEVVNAIAHIENRTLTLYSGNYSDFEEQRAAHLAQQQAAHERQQREIEHIRQFVDRFRAKATKARQAQSRLKTLERMERIAPAHVDSPFHFAFANPAKTPTPLLGLAEADLGYGRNPILHAVNLQLAPGDRIGLLGPNGAGKSTLVKSLAGELAVAGGERLPAQYLEVGYFAQHQLEQLDPGASPLVHLRRLDSKAPEQALRDFLGGFGFPGDMALRETAPFSGGEKARLALALVVYRRPNLLLLDEPTNHLDLDMRLALTVALQDFPGAVLLVSHDRHLLRSVADRFLLVHDGQVRDFAGDLDDYARWLRDGADDRPSGAAANTASRKGARREAAQRRQELQPLRRSLKDLEKRLNALEQRRATLEERLADRGLYDESRKQDLQDLLHEQREVAADLESTEARWLEIGERLEAAEITP